MFQAIFCFPAEIFLKSATFCIEGEFSHGTFQLIFRWFLLFCEYFLVSVCHHGIGCDVYCWMSCLDLKNIDQLLLVQLFCFLCFVICGIVCWGYTTRISLDFSSIFYEGHRFFFFCSPSLLLYNLHFSTLDNPLYSPLLERPKMIKIMSQTSIQHSLLLYMDNTWIVSSRDLWHHFSLNCFSKQGWLVPAHPYFKEFFVETFSILQVTKFNQNSSKIR